MVVKKVVVYRGIWRFKKKDVDYDMKLELRFLFRLFLVFFMW